MKSISLFFNRVIGRLPKRDQRSIYSNAKELTRLECYWSWKMREMSVCRGFYSSFASKRFNMDYGGVPVCIIGYIEHLEKEIESLKQRELKEVH